MIHFFIIICYFFCELTAGHNSDVQKYLHGRIDQNDKRYPSFCIALSLLQERDAKVLVETGTARYGGYNFINYVQDGGATVIFSDWAFQNRAKFFTVDINPDYLANAKQACAYHMKNTKFICKDSVEFLRNFHGRIDFLYLDSMDFDQDNPLPSQEHHLREIKAAYTKLHKQSVVMIDDCNLPHGGKGNLVIPFLESRGWKILYKGYQVICIKT